jgi:hypothetical protein
MFRFRSSDLYILHLRVIPQKKTKQKQRRERLVFTPFGQKLPEILSSLRDFVSTPEVHRILQTTSDTRQPANANWN